MASTDNVSIDLAHLGKLTGEIEFRQNAGKTEIVFHPCAAYAGDIGKLSSVVATPLELKLSDGRTIRINKALLRSIRIICIPDYDPASGTFQIFTIDDGADQPIMKTKEEQP